MSLGMILLAVWLILFGMFAIMPIPASSIILAIVSIIAGILLLANK